MKANEIYLVFDRYFALSFYDMERNNCSEEKINYVITGGSQKRPNDFLKSLKNIKYKKALVQFLSLYFKNQNFVDIIGKKKKIVYNVL